MKKGLRLHWPMSTPASSLFERGPDEEGIETFMVPPFRAKRGFERGPDEEGIETEVSPKCLKLFVRTRT